MDGAWSDGVSIEGEPLRILTDGLDPIPGATILEKRRYVEQHLDGLRRLLVCGHADNSCCALVAKAVAQSRQWYAH